MWLATCTLLHATMHTQKSCHCGLNSKQKDLETHIDHAPACIHFVQRRAQSLYIAFNNHDKQTEKDKSYLQSFDIMWETAPSQTCLIVKPQK